MKMSSDKNSFLDELDHWLRVTDKSFNLSPNLEGSSNGQHLSPISGDSRMVQDSSDGQLSFLDSLSPFGQNLLQDTLKTFDQIASAGAQLTSDESTPPVLFAQSGPKTPAMHRGKKRKDTADNLEGNYPTTAEINMPRGVLSGETLTPDALANTSQPLQNGMPSEDRWETSTIEGNNIRNAITDHGVVDPPTHMGAQPSLGSRSTQPSSSISSIENTKLLFKNLIGLPLEVLSYPENETSMKNVLTILANNLSSFSGKQGDQILGLLLEFPALVRNWREWYSQFQMYSQQSSAETEKIRDLVENSRKDEVSLKVRYDKLENKENELMTQLDEVHKQKAEIAERRTKKSKLTKDLKEKEAHRNKEERLMRIATAKLNNLSDQWAKLQSFFN